MKWYIGELTSTAKFFGLIEMSDKAAHFLRDMCVFLALSTFLPARPAAILTFLGVSVLYEVLDSIFHDRYRFDPRGGDFIDIVAGLFGIFAGAGILSLF